MVLEHRQRPVAAPSSDVFHVFTGLGGAGLRRGRQHPEIVRVGDAVDFWHVERVEPNRLLRLRAEMKLPGDAWLQFEATP